MKKIVFIILSLSILLLNLVSCSAPDQRENGIVYSFWSNGTEIAVDADAAPILAALGEWSAYVDSPSCAFVGLDKTYTYTGFEIQTYPAQEKDYVYMVILLDDTVQTKEGIAIGDSKDEVLTAYGTPSKQTDTALTYNGEGMYLEFLFRNGEAVTDIRYCKTEQ